MKTLGLILVACLIHFSSAYAHEGHDHGAPTFQPPKGGTLKTSLQGHFELVKTDKKVQIYLYDTKGNPKTTKGITLTSELEVPRKKSEKLVLEDRGEFWEAEIDAKGSHRYTLKIVIDDGKKKDKVKFTVENQ